MNIPEKQDYPAGMQRLAEQTGQDPRTMMSQCEEGMDWDELTRSAFQQKYERDVYASIRDTDDPATAGELEEEAREIWQLRQEKGLDDYHLPTDPQPEETTDK